MKDKELCKTVHQLIISTEKVCEALFDRIKFLENRVTSLEEKLSKRTYDGQ